MAHHQHHDHHDDQPLPPPAAVGHETSDAQAGPIIKFLVFLGVVTIVVAGLVVVFYNYLERREALEKTARYPLAAGRPRPLPAPPRLQTYPFDDIKDLRVEQRRVLDKYEWVDRNTGVVRIPIERAMDLIAERGLPHRQEGAVPSAAGAGSETASSGDATPASGESGAGETGKTLDTGAAPQPAATPESPAGTP
jgi:hypothetical protein